MSSEHQPSDGLRQALLTHLQGEVGDIGHTVIARELRRLGITHVYTVPGVPIDETLVACRDAGLRIISTRHQQAAVMAAGAHNWIAGGLRAAVVVSSGPGISNCITGITIARDNGWPLIVIGGRRDPSLDDRGGFQVLDGATLTASITRASMCIRSTWELANALGDMARTALRDRPGPCYADVLTAALEGREMVHGPAPSPHTDVASPALPLEWIGALAHARKPLLLLGNDLRFGAGFKDAPALVRRMGVPWATSPALRGLVEEDHDLCATPAVNRLMAEADFVLALGATFDWTLRHAAMLDVNTRVVRIGYGCDPVLKERDGSIDIDGNPSIALTRLISGLDSGQVRISADSAWLQQPSRERATLATHRRNASADTRSPITPALAVTLVRAILPASHRLILDGNVCMAWADRMLDVMQPLGRVTPGANGCMGTGLPFALGACMAEPDTPVVVITGDFALGACLQELETLVRYELPVTIVLLCNGGNSGRLRQLRYWPEESRERITRFVPDIRYDRIMIDVGGSGSCVDSHEGLLAALRSASHAGTPHLVQVNVRDDVPFPEF